jgi:hypothetical protein
MNEEGRKLALLEVEGRGLFILLLEELVCSNFRPFISFIETVLLSFPVREVLLNFLMHGQVLLNSSLSLCSHVTAYTVVYTSHQIDQGPAIAIDYAIVR